MPSNTIHAPFAETSLITPERVAADPREALAARPAWVNQVDFITPEPDHEVYPAVHPIVNISAGVEHSLTEAHTPLEAAVLWEITRLPGVSLAVNTNGDKASYFRFTIADTGKDLTTVMRFLSDAGPGEKVNKTEGREFDMRTETLRKSRAGKPSKDSRSILMGHIERIAREWEAKGTCPAHFNADIYLANLKRLIQLLDLEASGKNLASMLPFTNTRSAAAL